MFLKQYEMLFYCTMRDCPLCGARLDHLCGRVDCRSCGWSACD
jgi:hypothetical protein